VRYGCPDGLDQDQEPGRTGGKQDHRGVFSMSVETNDLLTSIHKALIGFNKRAERVSDEILEATFVDSAPLFEVLSTSNNQVIYGRRGTGKTHALKYLAQVVIKKHEYPVYIDLRAVGSNGSIYNDASRPLSERASTLIVDVLNALYNELYSVALEAIDTATHPAQITLRLDDFANAIQSVRISGSVEQEEQRSTSSEDKVSLHMQARLSHDSGLSIDAGKDATFEGTSSHRIRRAGS
jgi:hypothetical protein